MKSRCVFVGRMIALGRGSLLWSLPEFTEFIHHMLPGVRGAPCEECAVFEHGDLDPECVHPGVNEFDQRDWAMGMDAIFTARLPHQVSRRLWRQYETRWSSLEVFRNSSAPYVGRLAGY